ncbi:MAG: DUF3540 domain-containing protein [Deltaproteobacteria bacterium]|nr:DUF3540 domain-containing protein [Deltaproteobacteria bacterium]
MAVALEGSGSRDATARRAPSCLLSPQPGDRVLVGLLPEPYVLAVLERDRTRPAELAFEGDASVKAGGRLALGGDEGVSITSRRGISLLSRLLEVRARDGTLALERLTAVAKAAQAHCEKLGLFVQAYDLVAERVTERAKRIYRFVEEIEQLRARHLDYRAEETAQLRGENTVVAARQVVKVDGEQIHVG